MKLNLRVDWIRKLKRSGVAEDFKWASPEQWRGVDIESLEEEDLELLLHLMDKFSGVKGTVAVKQKINTFRKLRSGADSMKMTRLEPLVLAVKMLLFPTAHRWLFKESEDGFLLPWYVYDVHYHPPEPRTGNPAHTVISLAATKRGRKISQDLRFHTTDLGKTVVSLLRSRGYYVETPEIVQDYAAENAGYQKICGMTGEQFLAAGEGFDRNEWWASSTISMERDGVATRVVMDDESDEGESDSEQRTHITSQFWTENKKRSANDDGGAEEEMSVVDLPLHPYVKVFDLSKHCFIVIHAANLIPYLYEPELVQKLILPQDSKELISTLVQGADVALEDIVRGKTGGIIVICTGLPGTGKTLTAEVFSEQVKRPLYCVQCSQLGTDESTLEQSLRTVLSRAQRWRAILLIDEADVYVHARGSDIQQNAIVGVFLRVLEYYRGILFMTSNRETVIDDAIMSRATAWIRYDIPDHDRAFQIWRVLTAQYQIPLEDAELEKLIETFPAISGRSIKNLLKLAKLLARKNNAAVTVEMLRYVSRFLPLEAKKDAT